MTIGDITIPYVEAFLIIINLISFIVHTASSKMRAKKENAPVSPVLILLAISGGAAGILLSILFFERKTSKENMMLRITSLCFLIIEAIAFLIYKGQINDLHHFSFWKVFTQHRFLLYYIGGINLLTFIVFGVDKLKAKKEKPRVKIVTLLLLSATGGTVGGYIAMYLFRHKTSKSYFKAGIPLILLTQIAVIIYLMNSPWFSGIVQ